MSRRITGNARRLRVRGDAAGGCALRCDQVRPVRADHLCAVDRILMLALRRRPRATRQGLARPRPPDYVASYPSGFVEQSGEHGMVTAEFAVVLPAVVLVLALSLGALGLALDQIRCVDAARAGARAASRGDSDGAAILVTRRAAPSEALVSMAASGDLVRVSVVSRPRVAGCLFPAWLRASSTASAVREPSDPQQ